MNPRSNNKCKLLRETKSGGGGVDEDLAASAADSWLIYENMNSWSSHAVACNPVDDNKNSVRPGAEPEDVANFANVRYFTSC